LHRLEVLGLLLGHHAPASVCSLTTARYVAGLRREADAIEVFMTDLRSKVSEHEHAEAGS
jgi:hypothetical protein